MKFREIRGGLSESMETTAYLNTKQEFIDHVTVVLAKLGFKGGTVNFIEQGYDSRIGWDTHLVNLEGWGPIGMIDGPPPKEWWPPVKFEFCIET